MLSDRLMALIRNPETPPYAIRDAVMEEETPVPSVFVVVGATGEYSDRRDWSVAAFLDQDQAIAFVKRLNAWCKENGVEDSERGPNLTYSQVSRLVCPDDPEFQCDTTTGTKYWTDEIPLRVEE